MAVLSFTFGGQFCKRFSNDREEKHGIVTESSRSLEPVKKYAFGHATKGAECPPVLCGRNNTDETRGSFLRRHPLQFTKNALIVCVVVGVVLGFGGFLRSVSRGVYAGRTAESVDFQAGIIGQDYLGVRETAVELRLFAGIGLESGAVFDDWREG